jgi:hypothetical protein
MNNVAEQTIFENQNILPAQYFSDRPGVAPMEPLRRLAFAVLMDAVQVFQTNFGAPPSNRRLEFNEAQEWLLGTQGHGPFSFENVCFMLDVDPLRLRSKLRLWRAMKRAGQPCRSIAQRSRVIPIGSLRLRPRGREKKRG